MTLATAILFFGVISLSSVDGWSVAPSSQPQDSSATAPGTPATPPRQTESEGTKPSTVQAPASKPKASTVRKKQYRKKMHPAAACDPTPANSESSGSDPAVPAPQPGGVQTSSTPQAPKPCPPPKIVVRQGGISEQSIQLAGGSAGEAATQKRDAANRMLAATDDNLKQITGRQLATAEQDSLSQIRQFVDQAKAALTAGNLERAQTLAWKAKVLSDDLMNPKK